MTKKVEKPFIDEIEGEKIVENFQTLWEFTDILQTWIEKVCVSFILFYFLEIFQLNF